MPSHGRLGVLLAVVSVCFATLPSVRASPISYLKYSDIVSRLHTLAERYPEFCTVRCMYCGRSRRVGKFILCQATNDTRVYINFQLYSAQHRFDSLVPSPGACRDGTLH